MRASLEKILPWEDLNSSTFGDELNTNQASGQGLLYDYEQLRTGMWQTVLESTIFSIIWSGKTDFHACLYCFCGFCRVTEDGQLRLSDYGMTASLFPQSYYTADDSPAKNLVKWMAPETLENFEFTSKSDVVSVLGAKDDHNSWSTLVCQLQRPLLVMRFFYPVMTAILEVLIFSWLFSNNLNLL